MGREYDLPGSVAYPEYFSMDPDPRIRFLSVLTRIRILLLACYKLIPIIFYFKFFFLGAHTYLPITFNLYFLIPVNRTFNFNVKFQYIFYYKFF